MCMCFYIYIFTFIYISIHLSNMYMYNIYIYYIYIFIHYDNITSKRTHLPKPRISSTSCSPTLEDQPAGDIQCSPVLPCIDWRTTKVYRTGTCRIRSLADFGSDFGHFVCQGLVGPWPFLVEMGHPWSSFETSLNRTDRFPEKK